MAEPSQMDGATVQDGGSGVYNPEFDVEVKLIDENSPLYSVKSFEDLQL
jgi:ATP-dependent RNA helicase DDX19/DBP5